MCVCVCVYIHIREHMYIKGGPLGTLSHEVKFQQVEIY